MLTTCDPVSRLCAAPVGIPMLINYPKNILVLPDWTIRLIDFGICQVQDGTLITLLDENVGTRNYTSPECEAGEDGATGVHSDIYSAAKVLWSMVTSQRAFAREQPAFGNRSMEQIFPEGPDTWHLFHIFEKTIRHNPRDRAQTASQVMELVSEVRYLVHGGFPALKSVRYRCTSCGLKEVEEVRGFLAPFGNLPGRIVAVKCRSCGFVFLRDLDLDFAHFS